MDMVYLWCKLRTGQWEHALQLLDSMQMAAIHPTVVTYNTTISSLEKGAQWERALTIFNSMPAEQVSPDVITVNATISSCEKGGKWMHATKLLDSMAELSIAPKVITYNATISSCRKDGRWDIALSLLHDMFFGKLLPDVVSYNACMAVFETSGKWNYALELLVLMNMEKAVVPNVRTYNAAMRSCGKQWEIAVDFFDCMVGATIEPDTLSYNAVMGCFRSAEKSQKAFSFLNTMPHISLYSYNAALAACAKPGEWQLALYIFKKMPQTRVAVDVLSYNSTINSCEKSSKWQYALHLLNSMSIAALEATVVTYNAAISSVSSEWEQAVALFSHMRSAQILPDVITFNAMITAYGNSAQKQRALELLETMTKFHKLHKLHKLSPDVISFNAAIRSCQDNWIQATALFEQMTSYRLNPDLISYNSLVSSCSDATVWQRALFLLTSLQFSELRPDLVGYTSCLGGKCGKLLYMTWLSRHRKYIKSLNMILKGDLSADICRQYIFIVTKSSPSPLVKKGFYISQLKGGQNPKLP